MDTQELEQGSDEWFAARLGKVTASRVSDVVAKTKSGWSASRANYMAALICERLTGRPTESFTNAVMQHGTETEPEARACYEFARDVVVAKGGFISHPTIPMAGASPDGSVAGGGLVEIKCPNTATHINTLLRGSVPEDYKIQMQFQMACTGRLWCDWVSYDPRLPASMQLFVARVHRDADRIKELEGLVIEFLWELDEKIAKLRENYETPTSTLMAG